MLNKILETFFDKLPYNLKRKKNIPPTRYIEEFKKLVAPENKIGLEVGPLDRPFIDKSEYTVFYVDYFDESQLRDKIQGNNNRNPNDIVKLDYVLHGQDISTVVDRKFDYVFTSHVIEHLPNLFGWLNDIAKILNPGGIVFSIVPDSRYCFDLERPQTSLGELIENYTLNRRKPSPRHAFDQRFYHKNIKPFDLWSDYIKHKEKVKRTFSVNESYNMFKKAQVVYHDCHVNTFTPDSIKECLDESKKIGIHQFKTIKVSQTQKNKLDFLIAIQLN